MEVKMINNYYNILAESLTKKYATPLNEAWGENIPDWMKSSLERGRILSDGNNKMEKSKIYQKALKATGYDDYAARQIARKEWEKAKGVSKSDFADYQNPRGSYMSDSEKSLFAQFKAHGIDLNSPNMKFIEGEPPKSKNDPRIQPPNIGIWYIPSRDGRAYDQVYAKGFNDLEKPFDPAMSAGNYSNTPFKDFSVKKLAEISSKFCYIDGSTIEKRDYDTLKQAREENKDFYEVLDYYLEMIRELHKKTYEYLGHKKASTNPLGFCQGGFLGGNLKPEDRIQPLLKAMTASFGITALNELQQLYNGKSIYEDGEFALEVMKYINNKVEQFKEQDGNLYALYGTPAESLCGTQVEQFRKKYGIIKNVSDRSYVSNSFHCHVTEDITPIQKQDSENRFWNLFNGGKIQYCRYPVSYNKTAIKTLVRRAMDMGFYEGINLALSYCEDCGYEQLDMDVCPKCGSSMITKIDRMNGYLGFTRVKGKSRYNEAKVDEIKDRVSM